MKKIAVIFLVTLSVLAAGILAVSCNSAINEEFGTVVLDFGGSERALDSNALPVLSTVRIKAEVTSSAGRTVQEYNPGQEGNISLSLPVGERVVIKLSAYNASGIWSGTVTHTVEPGVNAASIKLSKKISGLNNILFTQKKDNFSPPIYILTPYMDGEAITVFGSSDPHVFARDSKGRLYVRYKASGVKLARYTSEGELDGLPVGPSASVDFLANDYTTGKMYARIGNNFAEIGENLQPGSGLLPSAVTISGPFAADKGIFAWANLGLKKIYLWKAGMTSAAEGNFNSQANTYGLGLNDGFKVKDLFIRGGYVYVLLTCLRDDSTSDLYSLGAVLKWKIGTDASGTPRFEGEPKVIGKTAMPTFADGVLQHYDYAENFYGAVKVIGFDDENLYIADDGFDAAYTDNYPRIVKNRNRIAVLNMNTNELTFTDAGPAKWYNEWNEWKGTKTIVWNSSRKYYQLEYAGSDLPSATLATGMTDIFAYDQAGNLYIYDKGPAYHKIKKFTLKDDGSYDTTSADLSMSLPASESMIGFAVVDTSTKSLYYAVYDSSTPASYKVKKMTWIGNFGSASSVAGYTIRLPASSGTVSALAANKDGVFAAVKTKSGNSVNDTYSIEVRKYSHSVSTVPEKTIPIVSDKALYQAIQGTDPDNNNHKKEVDETLTALHIKNGVLYALTTERTVKRHGDGGYYGPSFSYITGKLLQIGKDTSSFDEISAGRSVKQLYGYDIKDITPETSGDFAPVRFIAIKPKKLVIASTGYVFRKSNADIYPNSPSSPPAITDGVSTYKRKIYEFNLETAAMANEVAKDDAIFYKAFGACEYSW